MQPENFGVPRNPNESADSLGQELIAPEGFRSSQLFPDSVILPPSRLGARSAEEPGKASASSGAVEQKNAGLEKVQLPTRASKFITIPGPGGVPIELSPRDFLRNLESLSLQPNKRGQPNEWKAKITQHGQTWGITFRGDNRASIRVFTDGTASTYEALRVITEAAERAFPSYLRDSRTENRFSVRVIPRPHSPEQVVMARDVPAIPLVQGIVERLFECELGLEEPHLEQFEFKVPKLQLFHQGEERMIDVLVSYRYERSAKYPDFLRLDEVVKRFFQAYSDKDDYWEKVNKNLVRTLLNQYPMLDRIAVMVLAHPDRGVKTFRASTVMLDRRQLALEEAA